MSSLESTTKLRGIDNSPIYLPPERRLTLFALTCLIFFTTSGGAFGLEPLVGTVGPGWAVALILLAPLIWSLPIALMVAELASLMPEEGGYYIWVREALGPFWGVQEAWWTMSYAVVLLASFVVQFVNYLAFFIPVLASPAGVFAWGGAVRWLVAALVIASAMVVNLRGARDVGRSAKGSATFILGAFVLLVLAWLKRGPALGTVVGVVARDLSSSHKGALLLGLSYIVFNYSGWDNASSYAGEVDQAQRNYPRAIGWALLVVVLSYLLPVVAGLSVTTDPSIWSADAGWPVIARLIGGRWLGSLIAAAALVSMWTLFNAQLLYVSRLPFVMAYDGWLPKIIAEVTPGTAVPKIAILCFCAITAIFAALSLGSLVVIICLLNTGALLLEFLSIVVIRVRRPNDHRSFRVPGGWWGMSLLCLTWLAAAAVVLLATLRDWHSYLGQLFVVGFIVLSGMVLYFIRRRIAVRIRLEKIGRTGPPSLP